MKPPPPGATVNRSGMEISVDLKDFIDHDAEKDRLEKLIENLEKAAQGKQKQLANANFVQRAPEDVVQGVRDSLEEVHDQLASTRESLTKLGDDA